MNRWLYVFAGMIANVLLGTIYSWSVFRKPLESACGWTCFESGVPFSVFLLFFAVCMPLSGKLLKMYGPRTVGLFGALLVGVGWVLAGISLNTEYSLWLVVLFYGVVAGSGVAMIYNTAITVSSNWVPERRGLAVGLTVLGFGISPLVTAPLANYLISGVGVVNTFLIIGTSYAAILLLISTLMVLPQSAPLGGQQRVSVERASSSNEFTPSMMIRSRYFVGLWLAYATGTLGGFIAIGQAARFGQEVVRLSPELAAMATGVFAVFNGLGRPLFGYMGDKMRVNIVASLSFVLSIGAALMATQAGTLPLYLVSYSMLWLVFGGWLALAPKATSLFFGIQNLSVNYGIVFTAYGASALVGPTFASLLWDLFGDYSLVFMTVAVLSGVGLIISNLWLRPPISPKKEISLRTR